MWLLEYGFVDYHARNVTQRHADPALRDVLKEHEDQHEEPQILSLKLLSMSFGFLILGLLISTIVFILEVLSVTGPQKSFIQIFTDIKKNRENSNVGKGTTTRVFRRYGFKR